MSSGDTIPNCLMSSGDRVPGKPYLTAWANSGNSGRELALRLMAIRQARLEPLALSVYGRERMFNGWAAASEEKRIDFSARVAWFGDILNRRGVAHGDRAPFGLCQFVCRSGSSQRGRVCAQPDPAGGAGAGVGRKNSGQWSVASESEGREPVVREKRQNEANLPVVLIIGIL